jgi:hypothetical protein
MCTYSLDPICPTSAHNTKASNLKQKFKKGKHLRGLVKQVRKVAEEVYITHLSTDYYSSFGALAPSLSWKVL